MKFTGHCSRKSRQRHKRVFTDFLEMLKEHGVELRAKSPYMTRCYTTSEHEYLPVYQETSIRSKASLTKEELNKLKLHIQEYRLDCIISSNPLMLVTRKADGYLKSYIQIHLKIQD